LARKQATGERGRKRHRKREQHQTMADAPAFVSRFQGLLPTLRPDIGGTIIGMALPMATAGDLSAAQPS